MGYVEDENSKSKIPNPKEITSTKIQNPKQYDLEDRTLEFGKRIIRQSKILPRNVINLRLVDQLIRSGTSMGANYREANETETKKDLLYRIRICRKEGKETIYWLDLIIEANSDLAEKINPLKEEAIELVKIFATILENIKKGKNKDKDKEE